MKEHLKIAGKIALKSMAKWVLIVFLGGFVTIITFLISFFSNAHLFFEDNVTFTGYAETLISENFPAFVIIFGSPILLIVYIVMAKKISVQNSIYLLSQSKSGEQLISILDIAVDKITQNKVSHSDLINKAMLKAKVLQAVKENPETASWQRAIIQYGFRKMKIDDVDFQDENVNLSTIITAKFRQLFGEIMKPSLGFFWLMILIQLILSIWSIFL